MIDRPARSEVTRILQSAEADACASEELLPLVYEELRQLAAMRMARQNGTQTLQATALVHEAWLRLFGGNARAWQSRAHFFRAAAQAMRHILIERARKKMSLKRGVRPEYVSIENADIADDQPEERILLINDALERLHQKDAELAQMVMLKFFAGLTNAEVADTTGVAERTVQNKWLYAKAWLLKNIEEETRRAP